MSRKLDDPARDDWQRPDEVLKAMSLTPAMAVADVGAGTGYFAVRLARAVSAGRVLATDTEPGMVRYLRQRAGRDGLSNIGAVLATRSDAGIPPQSMDRILVTHVWHHLPDRTGLARQLAAGLRPGGELFIVDFDVDAERGPPPELRLPPESIAADLGAAGLETRVSAISLPGQYIVVGRRPATPRESPGF